MYRIEMLPAAHGDCLWVSWGRADAPRHMLIDGGPPSTAGALRRRIETACADAGGHLHIDLLVVTHIDADHIGGILDLLDPVPAGVTIGDVWFNGYHHLGRPDVLGADQGERLTTTLKAKELPWNRAFGGKAVVVPDGAPLPDVDLPGGMTLTLLSPSPKKLAKLAPKWAAEVREAERKRLARAEPPPSDLLGEKDAWPPDLAALAKAPFVGGGALANGSSIAFIARYDGRACLFGADAHADALTASLKRLGAPVKLDAFKLPHHGSAANLGPELLAHVDCKRFLISTNGDIFQHPDYTAIARILMGQKGGAPTLVFNYRSATTSVWARLPELAGAPAATIVFPPDGTAGAAVDV